MHLFQVLIIINWSRSFSELLNEADQPLHYSIAAKYGSNSIVPTRECTLYLPISCVTQPVTSSLNL